MSLSSPMARNASRLTVVGGLISTVALIQCKPQKTTEELLQSKAQNQPCTIPFLPAGTTAAAYQQEIAKFVQEGCFTTAWTGHDGAPRLTGVTSVTSERTTYSVHDRIQVYYSPSLEAWMRVNRPSNGQAPTPVAAMPDDAAMIAVVHPVNGPDLPSGFLVMVRQTAASSSRPASGWFFSQIVSNAATWGGTSLTTSAGDYSMGLCVGCHASAVNNLTFASTSNLAGQQPLPLPAWTYNFES